MNTLGDIIKKARIKKGLNQEELANQVGRSKSAVSNWERGDNGPEADILSMLCGILEISPNELLDWDNVRPNKENLSPSEKQLVKKYRTLDERGKNNIDSLLETEYQYILNQQKRQKPEEYTPRTIAAHNDGEWTDTHDQDVAAAIEFVRKKKEIKGDA